MKSVLFGLLALLLTLATGGARAQNPGAASATGNLIVGEKTFPLTFAYAKAEDDVEGNRLSGPQKSLIILLADTAVAREEVSDWFKCAGLARSGKLHSVRLDIDPATKRLFSVTIFYIASPTGSSPMSVSLSGEGLNYKVKDLKIAGGRTSGTAFMEKPSRFMEIEESDPPKTFTYNVSFEAPVWRADPITATLTGKAAQNSPQTAAVLSLIKAVYAGNLAGVHRYSLPNPPMEDFVQKEGVGKMKEVMKRQGFDPVTFKTKVQKIIVRGDFATLLVGDTRMKVARKNGVWKVAP